ncbi:MAG: AAA family ATPase [Mariprofundus sp.]|nr:AAA family ATPase [Mariprofundus sp.]
MYLEYFGLHEPPFSIAPNPRYLYLTHQHQEALAHLSYGLGSGGGIVLLTGEVGTGKTTISRKLLEDIPAHIEMAWIVNPRLSAQELLASICDELSIAYEGDCSSIKTFTDSINQYLIEAHGQGRSVVLMIDEAQNLSPDVLEQLRLLTNLETSERKLLQIILLGQPELKEMLERNDLRQLAQRITARFHLQSLSQEDSCEYVRHRMAIAGCNRPVFSNKAIDLVFTISQGTPRLINLLCDRALLGVYSRHETMVEKTHVQQASREVLGEEQQQTKSRWLSPLLMALALVIANAILLDRVWPWLPVHMETASVDSVIPAADRVVSDQMLSDQAIADQSIPPQSDLSQPGSEQGVPPALTESIEGGLRLLYATRFAMTESVKPESESSEAVADEISVSGLAVVAELSEQALLEQEQSELLQTESQGVTISGQNIVQSEIHAETIEQLEPAADAIGESVWQVVEAQGSKQQAFLTLASLWHVNLVDDKTKPCDQLAEKKLFCLQQRSNSWLLHELNRPALFQMTGEDGAHHFAVIRSVQERRVIIQLGEQQWNITLTELEQYWQGQLTLLWAKPEAYHGDVQQGDGGALIPWLADQMDSLQGKMIPPQIFTTMNAVLVERLKDFQISEGLPADGIVGLLTLMRINERIHQSTPLLNHGKLR